MDAGNNGGPTYKLGNQRWPFMYVEDQGWPHMSKVAAHESWGSTVDTCMSGINGGCA